MLYDLREAEEILARAHEKRDPNRRHHPRHPKKREEAAQELLNLLFMAAKSTGYEVSQEQGYFVISQPQQGAVYLRLDAGLLLISPTPEPDAEKWNRLPIEYDASAGIFLGQWEDTCLQQEPGLPKGRRNAVAAIAQVVVDMIEKQAPESFGTG